MRVIVITAIALAIIVLLAVPPTEALFDIGFMGGPVNIGALYAVGPDFTFAMPFSQGSYMINEARTSTLAQTAAGDLAISFLQPDHLASDGFPVISPTIAQTTSQTVAASRSYFFNDFLSG
jgi:hypothetical protein